MSGKKTKAAKAGRRAPCKKGKEREEEGKEPGKEGKEPEKEGAEPEKEGAEPEKKGAEPEKKGKRERGKEKRVVPVRLVRGLAAYCGVPADRCAEKSPT